MREIWEHLRASLNHEKPIVLVAIVEEHGSTPRGSGAIMLVGQGGRIAGTIGGGAVEKRSVEIAQVFLAEKRSGTYDFRLRENREDDLGMICGGDITVWFQYVSGTVPVWREIGEHRPYGGWLLLSLDKDAPVLIGKDGSCLVGSPPEHVRDLIRTKPVRSSQWFSMPLPARERAVIFGAGHIAAELEPLLRRLEFQVTVFDDRAEYADQARFPRSDVICGDYEDIERYLTLEPEDYVVIITEGHHHDFAVERQILSSPFPIAYIGVIGSKTKIAAVDRQLLDCGISEEALARVHAPIGMKIKSETPAEIAVSIAGEMIRVRAEHRESGGPAPGKCPMR